MKLLATLSAKKLITLSAVGVLSLATVGGVILNNSNEEPTTVQSSVTFDGEVKESPTAEIVEVEKVEETVAPSEYVPIVQEVTTPQPIKAPLDYAKEYLDLSGLNLQCFSSIIERYPSHFTQENMERNVKALRAFASVCASGVMSANGHIINIERSGITFFETEMAQRAINE